jgi:hypothetical protein
MAAMDEKFDRLFTETRALREELRAGCSELRVRSRSCVETRHSSVM